MKKKWLRRTLIAAALIGVGLAILYEYGTHVGRGWLNDEAFFQGRPTSYWRSSINGWVERFETPHDAEECMRANTWEGMLSSTAIIFRTPRPTLWTKARGWVGLAALPDDSHPPAVLGGFADAEPVLRELQDDPAMQRLVEQARRAVRFRGELRTNELGVSR
jgi:hypothetical protein